MTRLQVLLHRSVESTIVLLQGLAIWCVNLLGVFTSPATCLLRMRVIFTRGLNPATALDYALRWHGNKAILFPDRPLGYPGLPDTAIGIADVRDFVNRLANVLIQEAGLVRYDRVAVWKTNGPDYFLLSCAIVRAGGVSVPINPGMTRESLDHYLRQTGAKILFTDHQTIENQGVSPVDLASVECFVFPSAPESFPRRHIDLDTSLRQASRDLTPVELHADSDVLLVHTSGTTGHPKATIATSRSLISANRNDVQRLPMGPNHRVLTAAPFNHLFSHVLMFLCLLAGVPVWSMTTPDGETALKLIAEHRITFFTAFPVMYLRMFLVGLEKYDLSSIRAWLSVADAVHEVHMRAFARQGAYLRVGSLKLLSSIFLDGLGSSEVGSAGTRRYVFSGTRRFARNIGRRELAGPDVKCADAMGRRVPPGTIGRMYTRGNTLFKGYWNAHDRLHGTVMDGWWWTGDVVYQDWTGNYYHLDREADTIHTKEGPVYTLAVEEVAMNFPSVAEAACFGVPSAEGSEVALLVVCPRLGESVDAAACLEWIRRHQSAGIAVREVLAVELEEIPTGLTGKVLKRRLRTRYRDYLERGVLLSDDGEELPRGWRSSPSTAAARNDAAGKAQALSVG